MKKKKPENIIIYTCCTDYEDECRMSTVDEIDDLPYTKIQRMRGLAGYRIAHIDNDQEDPMFDGKWHPSCTCVDGAKVNRDGKSAYRTIFKTEADAALWVAGLIDLEGYR